MNTRFLLGRDASSGAFQAGRVGSRAKRRVINASAMSGNGSCQLSCLAVGDRKLRQEKADALNKIICHFSYRRGQADWEGEGRHGDGKRS